MGFTNQIPGIESIIFATPFNQGLIQYRLLSPSLSLTQYLSIHNEFIAILQLSPGSAALLSGSGMPGEFERG